MVLVRRDGQPSTIELPNVCPIPVSVAGGELVVQPGLTCTFDVVDLLSGVREGTYRAALISGGGRLNDATNATFELVWSVGAQRVRHNFRPRGTGGP